MRKKQIQLHRWRIITSRGKTIRVVFEPCDDPKKWNVIIGGIHATQAHKSHYMRALVAWIGGRVGIQVSEILGPKEKSKAELLKEKVA